jgi:hypothetical protein
MEPETNEADISLAVRPLEQRSPVQPSTGSTRRLVLFDTPDTDEQNPSTVAGVLRLRERQLSRLD